MKGFIRLEKKYGIKVVEDDIWHPFKGKYLRRFKIYSADGCPWENGLTRDGVKQECEKWSEELLEIKAIRQYKIKEDAYAVQNFPVN